MKIGGIQPKCSCPSVVNSFLMALGKKRRGLDEKRAEENEKDTERIPWQ